MFGPQREKTCNRCSFRPDFFLLVYNTNPPTVIFRKVEKKSFLFFIFHPLTLNIICFVEKKILYILRFCLYF